MKVTKNGNRWQAPYRNEKGKRKFAYSRVSPKDAVDKAQEMQETCRTLVVSLPQFPEGSYAKFIYEQFTPHVYGGSVATTHAKYDGMLRNHILPVLALKQVSEIGLDDFNELKSSIRRVDKRAGKPSDAHVREILMLAKESMTLAHRLGLTKTLDWMLIKIPKKPQKKFRTLPDVEPIQKLLAAASGTWMYGPIVATLYLGFRRCEVTGLKKGNLKGMGVLVSEQLQIKKFGGQNPTKGRKHRFLPTPKSVWDLLINLSDPSSIYVFTKNGKPIDPNKITAEMPKLCAAAGIDPVTFHDLRSYYSSYLADENVNVVAIQELLGHGELSTTQRYVNAGDNAKREGIQKVVDRLAVKQNKSASDVSKQA